MSNQEISISNFKSSKGFIKKNIINTHLKNIVKVEYRTLDEGMCSANYFIFRKNINDISNKLEAFTTLWNFQLHFYEEWDVSEISIDDSENIMKIWLLPALEGFCFEEMSGAKVIEETTWIIDSIEKIIQKDITSTRSIEYSNKSGIYKNGELVDYKENIRFPTSGEIVSAIGLVLEWNEVEIFYETNNEFVYFSWGTAA